MERFDAVVVGSGPAGSSCAKELAKNGLKVLILEKEKLPRFKLCGGCLSARVKYLLPEGWEREVLNEIRGGILGFKGREFIRKHTETAAYIIDRGSFDMFLTESALKEGAELSEGEEFIDFEESGGRIAVYTNRRKIYADFLIGADGFYTKVGRKLGFKKEKFFRSVEFWTEGELKDTVVIDIGLVKRGYAWIFPKGNSVSVGIASTGRENLKKILEDYIKEHPFIRRREIKNLKGWMIPFAESEKDIHFGKGRILLVGDAGNFVDPLLGEGIYYAILSGKFCAKSIIENGENPLENYRRYIRNSVLEELIYAGKIAGLAYRFQRVAYRMGKGYALDRFFELLRGRKGYKELYKKGLLDFVISVLHFENFLHIIIDSKILKRR